MILPMERFSLVPAGTLQRNGIPIFWQSADRGLRLMSGIMKGKQTNWKRECGITKETSGQFDRALTNLQKNLFITMCGRRQKLSRNGEPYGWNSTVFTTVEDFWGGDFTADMSADEAYEKIRERILGLNPEAKEKDIRKFIG